METKNEQEGKKNERKPNLALLNKKAIFENL